MTDRDSRLRVLRETSALTHGLGGRRKPAADKALTVRVEQEPGYVLISVAGEIDIATVARLEEELAALSASAKPLVADLEEVRFIDAAGLRALGRAAGQAAAHGWTARYCWQGRGLRHSRRSRRPRRKTAIRERCTPSWRGTTTCRPW